MHALNAAFKEAGVKSYIFARGGLTEGVDELIVHVMAGVHGGVNHRCADLILHNGCLVAIDLVGNISHQDLAINAPDADVVRVVLDHLKDSTALCQTTD